MHDRLTKCWLAKRGRRNCASTHEMETKPSSSRVKQWRFCQSFAAYLSSVISDRRSFQYMCRYWGQRPHSCNPNPFLSTAWARSLNLSLTPEEKNPSTLSPERLSLQTKTESMGGQSHILILGQRTWIWYEPGNSPVDFRVSPGLHVEL